MMLEKSTEGEEIHKIDANIQTERQRRRRRRRSGHNHTMAMCCLVFFFLHFASDLLYSVYTWAFFFPLHFFTFVLAYTRCISVYRNSLCGVVASSFQVRHHFEYYRFIYTRTLFVCMLLAVLRALLLLCVVFYIPHNHNISSSNNT